ncbi:MAG: excisionase family DNA-binding protein [Christensenellales bacterium]
MENRDTYNRSEAAQVINISLPTLDKLIKDGKLRAIRIGQRRIIIPKAAVAAFLEGRNDA